MLGLRSLPCTARGSTCALVTQPQGTALRPGFGSITGVDSALRALLLQQITVVETEMRSREHLKLWDVAGSSFSPERGKALLHRCFWKRQKFEAAKESDNWAEEINASQRRAVRTLYAGRHSPACLRTAAVAISRAKQGFPSCAVFALNKTSCSFWVTANTQAWMSLRELHPVRQAAFRLGGAGEHILLNRQYRRRQLTFCTCGFCI